MSYKTIYNLKNKAPLIVDFSHWQGNVDVEKLKNAGVQAAIVKAGEVWMRTQGKPAIEDPKHRQNIENLKKTGLICGDYYFWHPKAGAEKQANHYWKISLETDLPPVIDVETFDGYTYEDKLEVSRQLYIMCKTIANLFGRQPIIYTRNALWVNQIGNPKWGHDYLFWLAQYNVSMDYPCEDIRDNVIMWQFTDRIQLPGLPTMDGNYWLQSENMLALLAGKTIKYEPIEIWRIRKGLYPLSKKNREWLDMNLGGILGN